MMVLSKLPFSALLLATFCWASGCGGGPNDLPDLGQVSGKVTLNGNPLADAQVTFTPVDTDSGNTSSGTTDSSGAYELHYTGENMGAIPGEHKVTIIVGEGATPSFPEGVDPDKLSPQERQKYAAAAVIPAKYNSESTLTETVKSGPNTINFELTSE
ncbi:carboxypeptidase-like regulatory domain-containing protein [Rubinisphaera italica]|uniref:Bacterial Ig-like domain (Group 1) n=1 Tax=Rubinisphaera italica TaxID=2527969 RepID=A0A5C5XC20_9PLAN|nr:carboxypeptidase-like regulatory domain-containing protein [Rubinisphaera italica]TWT59843.1 Bacterial Ig-like domain (group 1) [Rubinisphaera italica]